MSDVLGVLEDVVVTASLHLRAPIEEPDCND
jgi:hypothetical protein